MIEIVTLRYYRNSLVLMEMMEVYFICIINKFANIWAGGSEFKITNLSIRC